MTDHKKIRVVLVGGSGYAGFEVIRWLGRHRYAELVGVFGSGKRLGPMDELYPLLNKQTTLVQERYEVEKLAALNADLVMLCVPHKVAMSYVPAIRKAGMRVIDWSADYRIADADKYEKWYCPHTDPEGLAEAVYGLPEHFARQIKSANIVANPGCYPTSAIIPLVPLLTEGLIEPDDIIVNSASAISGAGRTPSQNMHFPERNENFEAYKVGSHRHMPEIDLSLKAITGRDTNVLFVPHLVPMDRGILSTIYAKPTKNLSEKELTDVLHETYARAPFVRVRDDILPATKYVAYTNFCDIAVRSARGRIILFGAIDNLIKGASGQAIQNMNLMFGFDEAEGLY